MLQKRQILSKESKKESKLVQEESMKVLAEFVGLKMKIKQFEVWVADLNPGTGTKTGKIGPILIVQTDLLSSEHPSTIGCLITTNVQPESNILRVHLKNGMAKLKENCDIMIGQVRSINNKRLIQKTGIIPEELEETIKHNLKIVLDL